MIESVPGLPDGALGFNAHGTITAQDYETVIIPAVEAQSVRVFRESGLAEAVKCVDP